MRRCGAFLLLLAGTGCARPATPPPQAPDSPRVQAALAVVTVDNRTPHSLSIEFRTAGRDRGRVTIGTVPAGAVRRLAPIPAAEPIVLVARSAEGGSLELGVRTFAVDEQWLWVLPPETVFR